MMAIPPEAILHQIEESTHYLQQRFSTRSPQILLTQGTGQDFLPNGFVTLATIDYLEIPNFLSPTVTSHKGRLVLGTVAETTIAIMQGRLHFYEGFEPHELLFPIRVLQQVGCNRLIATNTAGGLNLSMKPGAIMVISDHINAMGINPLRGPNIEILGPRFPDMSQVYSKKLISLFMESAQKCGVAVSSGIYAAVAGPSLETPAETRLLRNAGADAVGMSTVPEVIGAVHLGMEVLGISLIANVNDPDNFLPILVEDVILEAQKAQLKLQTILADLIPKMRQNDSPYSPSNSVNEKTL